MLLTKSREANHFSRPANLNLTHEKNNPDNETVIS